MNSKLSQIIAELFDLPPHSVGPHLSQDDIAGWDSQGHLELIMALESAFGVELELGEVTQMRSVADIESILLKKCKVGS